MKKFLTLFVILFVSGYIQTVAAGEYYLQYFYMADPFDQCDGTRAKCAAASATAACGMASPGLVAVGGPTNFDCKTPTTIYTNVHRISNPCYATGKGLANLASQSNSCTASGCSTSVNPVNGSCDEVACASQAWDNASGACIDQDCADNEMQVVDESYSSGGCTGSGCSSGTVSYCHGFPTCTNSLGNPEYDSTFSYCQEAKDECDDLGGVYGAIGTEGGARQVCLVDYSDPTPTCASGSQMMLVCDDATNSCEAKCTSTDNPPNTTCDGKYYDCDGEGNVDDQDHDGCKDNGTENAVGCEGIPPGGPGTGPGDPGGPNVGEDPLSPPVEGAGDCDPTAQNYGDCAGIGGIGSTDPGEADSALGTELTDALAGMGAETDALKDSMIDELGDGESGIEVPGWVDDIGDTIFPDVSCSGFSFTWKGQTMAITCEDTEPMRDLLGFFVAALTVIVVVEIAVRKPTA